MQELRADRSATSTGVSPAHLSVRKRFDSMVKRVLRGRGQGCSATDVSVRTRQGAQLLAYDEPEKHTRARRTCSRRGVGATRMVEAAHGDVSMPARGAAQLRE